MAHQEIQKAAIKPSYPTYRDSYLVFYNVTSAGLRIAIFSFCIWLWYNGNYTAVWTHVHPLARWAETLAVVEIIHAASGLVRASPTTTALQVAGRNTIVWAITRNYPVVAARDWAYPIMIITWNLADAVRYVYFTIDRGFGAMPRLLLWLRYNC